MQGFVLNPENPDHRVISEIKQRVHSHRMAKWGTMKIHQWLQSSNIHVFGSTLQRTHMVNGYSFLKHFIYPVEVLDFASIHPSAAAIYYISYFVI